MTNLMSKESRYDALYMDMAERVAQMSYDRDRQVGAVLVKDGNIIAMGWNGTPAGMDNECKASNGATLPCVIHAEVNAIAKCAKSGSATEGATLYCTLSPCMDCTKLILQAGIKEVIVKELYEKGHDAWDLLKERKMVHYMADGSRQTPS